MLNEIKSVKANFCKKLFPRKSDKCRSHSQLIGSVFDPASKNPRNDADHFVIGDELEAAVHHDAMWNCFFIAATASSCQLLLTAAMNRNLPLPHRVGRYTGWKF